ncbi:alkylated DNA repair protein AlkB [Spizellomyces punctatus DAOM BR117]|uniref:Alkylated DNA repair protein AlkB n=1 Tax=Spizellomyces punctatus (strain DAOM BR117) TaxID=645134 RepID=A0A0L0H819_SPIPD|nr:alkylated DNA repair protein AlkB [Spizellomyces punctatus DAOM BR117]KNC97061.1 alkylated DNA repair protein AlkB [Spizellomyces punctatus DAOM BR117]|eukprot:XP_016605101.1 alkylated DNA repair protein AlkB [Spizellomyces punctatus DAOM BR117]
MGRKKQKVLPPDSPLWANQTAFRVVERSWKRKEHAPDLLKTLVDPSRNAAIAVEAGLLKPVALSDDPRRISPHFGFSVEPDTPLPPAYELVNVPGLVIIPNMFSPSAQRTIIKQCLKEYTRHPNVTNLDTHWKLPSAGIWNLHELVRKGEIASGAEETLLRMRHDGTVEGALKNGYDSDVNEAGIKIDPPTTDTHHLTHLTPQDALLRLRWTSLGFQYNWSTKEYHLDRRPSFPPLIGELSTAIVEAVQGVTGYEARQWKAEAGIINFYGLKDALMAHQDRSEENAAAPLVSFSFGHSCIFLIGTESRDDIPTSVVLRSGDVLVMHGQSRLAFHSVPRILENTLPEYLFPHVDEAPDWDLFAEYMAASRININVRQVK